uniref:Uncharacterized protein n=1 Tax=Anopheles darlingi TaxID=43151 RepID=A0A2M4DCG0_ANODA
MIVHRVFAGWVQYFSGFGQISVILMSFWFGLGFETAHSPGNNHILFYTHIHTFTVTFTHTHSFKLKRYGTESSVLLLLSL